MGIQVAAIKEIVATPTTGTVTDQLERTPIEERTSEGTITIGQGTAIEDAAFKIEVEVIAGMTINRNHQERRVTKGMVVAGNLSIDTEKPASMKVPIAIIGPTTVTKLFIALERDKKRRRFVDERRFGLLKKQKKKAVGARKSECATRE